MLINDLERKKGKLSIPTTFTVVCPSIRFPQMAGKPAFPPSITLSCQPCRPQFLILAGQPAINLSFPASLHPSIPLPNHVHVRAPLMETAWGGRILVNSKLYSKQIQNMNQMVGEQILTQKNGCGSEIILFGSSFGINFGFGSKFELQIIQIL